jgi:hypothetical protein
MSEDLAGSTPDQAEQVLPSFKDEEYLLRQETAATEGETDGTSTPNP